LANEFDIKEFNFKKLKIKASINLKNRSYKATLTSNLLKNKKFFAKDIKLNLKNNTLNFDIKTLFVKDFYVKNLNAKKIKGSYKNNYLIANADLIDFIYKNSFYKLKKPSIVFKSKENFSINAKKATLKKDFTLTTTNLTLYKLNNFLYINASDANFLYKFVSLFAQNIFSNNSTILIPKINGYIAKNKTDITNTKIDYIKNTLTFQNANVGTIKLFKTEYNFKKNILNSSLKFKIDKSIKNIAKEFNISIPITQLSGNFFSKVNYFNNNFSIYLTSKDSTFKFKKLLFYSKKINANISKNKTDISIFNFALPRANLLLDANITKKKYFYIYSLIKEFSVPLLNIKNFVLKGVSNLDKIYFLTLPSEIDKEKIKIFSIKPILKYSPFRAIIEDANAEYKLKKDLISVNIKFSEPLFNKKNDSIYILLNPFKILNKNIKITFDNALNFTLNNTSINLYAIEKFINALPKNNSDSSIKIKIDAKDTNITYKNFKLLSEKFNFFYDRDYKFSSYYKQNSLKGYTKHQYLLIEGKNFKKEELIYLLSFFKNFYNINLDFIAIKSPDGFLTGKIFIKKGRFKDFATINNILAFINTIPSLLTFQTPGFSTKGYKFKDGVVDYIFFNNLIYFKKIFLKGENIDMLAKGYVDLNKNFIKLKLTAKLKLKLKNIPIIGKGVSYILFGKDGSIDIKMIIKGDLNNPKVTQDIGEDILLTPFKLFKRAITLPFNIF